jgi:glycosyltransferase involved in cell wall biosynthesis
LTEVIVSKNFDDKDIDGYALSMGFKLHNIDLGPVSAGCQLASALDMCRGRIVALLDDDDFWSPSRLSRVATWFLNHPDLQYYANTHRPFNSNGVIDFGKKRGAEEYYRLLSDGSVRTIDPGGQTLASIDSLFLTNPGNNSSIAVTRDLLVGSRNDLSLVLTSIDHFLLVAALLGDGAVVIENLPLTIWQRHSQNASQIDVTTFSSFKRRVAETASRIASDNRVFLDMSRRHGHTSLSSYLARKVSALEEIGTVLRKERVRKGDVTEAISLIREAVRSSRRDYWTRALLRARIARLISPEVAQMALFLYLRRESAI